LITIAVSIDGNPIYVRTAVNTTVQGSAADIILTYFAKDAARYLNAGP